MAPKKILIIGGTGAQGLPIAKELTKDGKYEVRILTRDPSSRRAKQLQELKGVELIKGDIKSTSDLKRAFEGVDSVFANTDTFTIGERAETFYGIRIFELAKAAKNIQYFIWSDLPYIYKKSGYNEMYNVAHYSAKARVTEFIRAQEGGEATFPGLKYSFFSTCIYTEMMHDVLAPIKEGDKYVFVLPVGEGHIPFIALEDLGKYARYHFDHIDQWIGKSLDVASDLCSLKDVAEAFTRATGKPSEARAISSDAYFANFDPTTPLAYQEPDGITFVQNFKGFWAQYRDDLALKDMKFLDTILPERLTLEKWIKKNNYTGDKTEAPAPILKMFEDGHGNVKRL